MVMQAITNAAQDQQTLVITEDTAVRSIRLSRYILHHKLALITDPTETPKQPAPILTKQDLINDKTKLKKLLTQTRVSPRVILTQRLTPTDRPKTSETAKQLITSLAVNGFGDVVAGTGSSVFLRRRPYDSMTQLQQELFDSLDISHDIYEKLAADDTQPAKKNSNKAV